MNIIELLVFLIPAFVANAAPVVFGGRGPPLDLNATIDNKPVLGKSKTIVGLVSGILAGTLSGIFLLLLPYYETYSALDVLFIAFILSCGAMAGDVAGSFIKRRMGMQAGQKSVIMDRVLFAVLALAFAIAYQPALFNEFGIVNIVLAIVITFFLHRIANFVAHKANIKNVPW